MDRSKFKFSSQIRVRNYEVDWQGIVHNATYLLYFEVGRIEYLKNIKLLDVDSIAGRDSYVLLARNEIDYRQPARFDEVLTVHTRISYIRNTSFAFEGFIESSSGSIKAENVAIHVWVDRKTGTAIRAGDNFRRIVGEFEGKDIVLLESDP